MADGGSPAHRWPVRVYYEDTDAGGIVYHASYLRFAERARTEFLRDLGFGHRALQVEFGVLFAVRRVEVDYLKSARLDEELSVVTRIGKVGGASMDLVQEVEREDGLIARLRIRLALLDRRGRAARLPLALKLAVERMSGAAGAA